MPVRLTEHLVSNNGGIYPGQDFGHKLLRIPSQQNVADIKDDIHRYLSYTRQSQPTGQRSMSGLLWSLAYVTLLPIVWAVVAGSQRARQPGGFDNSTPRRQAAALTGLGERTNAAQQNAWEALMMYTPAVMIATLTGADAGATTVTGLVFCVARSLHGVLYCLNLATLRSLTWFVGIGCTIYLIVLAA